MSTRTIILFDVMETLVTEPFFTAMPSLFGMTLDELLEAKHPTAWIEFEKGQLTEEAYCRKFFRDGRPVDSSALRECLQQSYRWLDGMHDLLAELHAAGYEMHALSNYPVWYRLIDQSLGLSRYLQWSFVSCQTGVRKPDHEAFLHPVRTLGVPPSALLFVDDRQENVAAAASVGLDAILMQGAGPLRGALTDRGLLR